MKCEFKIKGLDCANCAAELERAISKIKGVEKATISFMTEKMTLELEDENSEEIMKEIKKVINKEEPDVVLESKN